MSARASKVASALMTVLVAGGIGAARAEAQAAPPAPPASALRCDDVLAAEKAAAIMGDGFSGPAVTEYRPGFTSCDWQGEHANFGFSFTNLKALAAEEETADYRFEMDVLAMESDGRTREMLTGIGTRAATMSAGDDALFLAVQRPDGVGRMITYKVSKAKLLALAKAIATP